MKVYPKSARESYSQNRTTNTESDMSGTPFGISANPEGGYAVGGAKTGLPLGRATLYDKIVGNLDYFLAAITRSNDQKVSNAWDNTQALTNSQQLAKLRKYGGKKAVIGEARSPKF
ncbi:hypothetical protein E3P99_01780 [Wallemia hederae]|uniref:Uncharacterized protein n=1 Tax=Wallemia hederae TaxID=1540922 RepID=A0A4T0FN56_9BASI|nr:hypothetical protein E3P99_01780 [Wallemia hederae]